MRRMRLTMKQNLDQLGGLFARSPGVIAALALTLCVSPRSAQGSFHFMQIEQVIASVDGDSTAQAIQLRMRSGGQDQVSRAKLRVFDANGRNPIVLIDFDTNVPAAAAGRRILIASERFSSYTHPAAEPDYVMQNLIPVDYLICGSLVFQNDEETLLVWRLSWGGLGYTGSTTGAQTNDDDLEFGPPFDDPLPGDGFAALQFQGTADHKSESNVTDYVLSNGAGLFTNNANASFTVTELQCPNDPQDDMDGDRICGDVDNCPTTANGDQADFDNDGRGDECDICPFESQTATDATLCPDDDDDGSSGDDDNGTPDDGSDDPDDPADGTDDDPDGSGPDDDGGDDGGTDDDGSDTTDDNGSSGGNGRMCGFGMVPVLLFATAMRLFNIRGRTRLSPI